MLPSLPEFRGLDEARTVTVYRRNLPHWRQPGATYFVTFRLADSIPRQVIEAWGKSRKLWLEAHSIDPDWLPQEPERFSTAYKAISQIEREQFEKHQARQLHIELDRCHGCCLLKETEPSQLLAEALRFFNSKRWWLGDFVIMPNHVHLLAQPHAGWDLEELLGGIKKFASRQINQRAKDLGQQDRLPAKRLWQQESYDRIVRDTEELAAYRRYIAANPAKAHLHVGQYRYYRAEWLDAFAPLHDIA